MVATTRLHGALTRRRQPKKSSNFPILVQIQCSVKFSTDFFRSLQAYSGVVPILFSTRLVYNYVSTMHSTVSTEGSGVASAFYTCIREVICSNLGQDTCYPEVSSGPSSKISDGTPVTPRSLPSKPIQIHYSPTTPQSNSISSSIFDILLVGWD